MSDEDKINILRIRYLKNRFLNGMDQGCYRLCASSLRSTIYLGWSCTFENFQTPSNMTSERFNLVSHDTVTFEPLTFCKRSFRLLWMKPSHCTSPSHSYLGHGINQTFIAGNSLQISACHVYQSVWQMISPLPRATAIFGRVSLSWFLGRARPGALRSGVPCQAFHPRVPSGDWLRGNSFGINSPPPFLPNYLNVFLPTMAYFRRSWSSPMWLFPFAKSASYSFFAFCTLVLSELCEWPNSKLRLR